MKSFRKSIFTNYGIGHGLRFEHFPLFLESAQAPAGIRWVEVISENFMAGPKLQNTGALRNLLKIRENHLVALHGVSLSIGSASDLNPLYLKNLKTLVNQVQPISVSDHLCWTRVDDRNTHDLNPIPYTRRHVEYVAQQISRVQDILGRRMLIENVSTYLTHERSEMSEVEFLNEVLKRADCGMILDINNVYVSATNHGFDARKFLAALPTERMGQVHLAGHSNVDGFLIDTHDEPVPEAVWELYDWYGRKFGHPSVMIERDGNIPSWPELEKEIKRMSAGFKPNSEISLIAVPPLAVAPLQETLMQIEDERADQHRWVDSLIGEYSMSGIVGDDKKSDRLRFEVYEDAYWIRLRDAITADFIEFKKAIPEEEYDDLVSDILSRYPSRSYSIAELGLRFLEGLRESKHPHFAIAEQDWARNLAYFQRASVAAPGVETDFSRLALENPDDFDKISVVLHPSVQMLADQKCVYWHDHGAREKSFNEQDWPAIVALSKGLPISQWETIPGLSPRMIQKWTEEGLIRGYQKN